MELLTFGITGRIPSKKNSKRIFRKRDGTPFVASSEDYKTWHREHVHQLAADFPGGLTEGVPVNVEIVFTSGDRRKFDLTNKAESIMDLMVDAGIIADDNFNVVPSVCLRYAGYKKGEWYALVTLSHA